MKGDKAEKERRGAGQAAKNEQMAQLRWPKGIEIVVDDEGNGEDEDAHKATHGQLAGVDVLQGNRKKISF